MSMETSKENAVAEICKLAEKLNKLNVSSAERMVLPSQYWNQQLLKWIAADNAMDKFKKNSSYWPQQFPWYSEYFCTEEEISKAKAFLKTIPKFPWW